MAEVYKTVFHGTALSIIGNDVLNGNKPLIGRRDRGDRSISGTLTDVYEHSAYWAVRRGLRPLILTYNIPQTELIDEGLIAMSRDAHGFVTNREIDYKTLLKLYPSYLTAMYGLNGISKRNVKFLVDQGIVSFHTVPPEYLESYTFL